MSVSSWILASCQPHRVTSRQPTEQLMSVSSWISASCWPHRVTSGRPTTHVKPHQTTNKWLSSITDSQGTGVSYLDFKEAVDRLNRNVMWNLTHFAQLKPWHMHIIPLNSNNNNSKICSWSPSYKTMNWCWASVHWPWPQRVELVCASWSSL